MILTMVPAPACTYWMRAGREQRIKKVPTFNAEATHTHG